MKKIVAGCSFYILFSFLLFAESNVSGKVFYGKIQVEDGGKLIGEINYRDKENKQEEFKDWKAL